MHIARIAHIYLNALEYLRTVDNGGVDFRIYEYVRRIIGPFIVIFCMTSTLSFLV